MSPPNEYDFFVSYADADRAWVKGYLLDALSAADVSVISEDAFKLGAPRLNEFERAVRESRRVLLVISAAYLADEVNAFVDLLAQQYGMETGVWPVIPILREAVETLPTRLSMLVSLRATDEEEAQDAIDRLLAGLERAPTVSATPPCPYPGMRTYTPAESQYFFGRSAEIDELRLRLRKESLILIVGPSGSGKSSLALAGLAPQMENQSWQIVTLRPGQHPKVALNEAWESVDEPGSDKPRDGQGGSILVIVDQLEELFTLAATAEERRAFINALIQLSQKPAVRILLTMRADFFGDLMQTEALWRMVRDHRLEVDTLNDDNLREAIIKPAGAEGVYVEPALVERLVADAAGQRGMLPFVQETLVLLWDKLERRFLPLRAYEALVLPAKAYAGENGLLVAMGLHADSVYADLTTAGGKALARRTFLRLVQFGDGREDTRRQQNEADLRAAGDDKDEFDGVLAQLVDKRLLTKSGEETNQERKVDLAHEALIQGWPTLRTWIQAQREVETVRRRLEGKAKEWVRLGKGEAGLLRDYEVKEAEEWQDNDTDSELGSSADLLALLEMSRQAIKDRKAAEKATRQRELEQERKLTAEQRQRAEEKDAANESLKKRLYFLVALGIVALILAASALFLGFRSSRNAAKAQEQEAVAIAAQSTAVAETTKVAETAAELKIKVTAEAIAVREAQISESRALSSISAMGLTSDPVEALSLALDALPSSMTSRPYVPEAEFALMQAMQESMETGYYESAQPSLTEQEFAFSDDHLGQGWVALGGSDVRLVASDLTDVILADALKNAQVAWLNETMLMAWDGAELFLWTDPSGEWTDPQVTNRTVTGSIDCVVPRPSSTQFALCVDDSIQIWAVEDNAFVTTTMAIETPRIGGRIVRWSPSGTWLVTSEKLTDQSTVPLLWRQGDENGLQISSPFTLTQPIATGGFQFVNEEQLATWDNDGVISLLNLEADPNASNQSAIPVRLPTGSPIENIFSVSSGDQFFVAYKDGTGALWALADEPSVAVRFDGHQGPIRSVAWHPDQPIVATAADDGVVRVWRIEGEEGAEINQLVGHGSRDTNKDFVKVYQAGWTEDGDELITVGEDGTIRTWMAYPQRPQRLEDEYRREPADIGWRDSETLLVAHRDGIIDSIDVIFGETVSWTIGVTTVNDLVFHPSEPLAFALDGSDTGLRHDLDSRTSRQLDLEAGEAIKALALSSSGMLALGRVDGRVDIGNPNLDDSASWQLFKPSIGGEPIKRLLWSSDGEELFVATKSVVLRCSQVADRAQAEKECRMIASKHEDSLVTESIEDLFLSPSDRYLALKTNVPNSRGEQLIVVDTNNGEYVNTWISTRVIQAAQWVNRAPWPHQSLDTEKQVSEDLLLIGVGNMLTLWDPRVDADIFQMTGEPDVFIGRIRVNPSQARIATLSYTGGSGMYVDIWPSWIRDPDGLLRAADAKKTR